MDTRLRLALALTGGSFAVLGAVTTITGLAASAAGAAEPSVALAAAAAPVAAGPSQADLDREARPLGCLEDGVDTARDLFHTVRRGETLSGILDDTEDRVIDPLSVAQAVERNSCLIDDADEIRPGMILSLGRRPSVG